MRRFPPSGLAGVFLKSTDSWTEVMMAQPTDASPLYNSRIIKTYLDYVEKNYPEIDADCLLDDAGMSRYDVADPAHWFTQDQTDRFNQVLVAKTGNPNIPREAGRYTISSKGLGPVKRYILGLMNLEKAFLVMEKIHPLMSRGATVSAKRLGLRKIEIVSKPLGGVDEKPYQCENRMGTFESLAILFTDRFARIEHPVCFHKGGEACHYVISWAKSASVTWKMLRNLSIVVGLPIGIILSFTLSTPLRTIVLLALFGNTLILSLMAEYLSRRELVKTLSTHGQLAKEELEDINRRYSEALLIQEVGQATASITDMKELMEKLAALFEKRLKYDRGLIMLANRQRNRLVYFAGYGHTQTQKEILRSTTFHLDDPQSKGLFVRTFKEQKSFLTNDIAEFRKDFSVRSQSLSDQMQVTAIVCVPIVYQHRSLGILAVDNIRSQAALSGSDLNLLAGIASQIAISINNTLSFEDLTKSEQKFRDILDKIEEGYFEIDLTGTFTYVNGPLCKMTGYSRQELIGTSNRRYGSKQSVQKMYAVFSRIYRTGQSAKLAEFEIIGNGGNIINVELSASLIRDQQNGPVGFRGVIRDVTERLRVQEEQRQLEAQLLQAQKMETIGRLAGGVAHNFNNFLAGIQGNISLIRGEESLNEPLLDERLSKIEQIVQSASQLNRQLLGYARKGRYQVKTIDLNKLIQKTAGTLSTAHQNIEIHLDLSPELRGIEADESQIEQVLWNLYVNSADALPQGGDIWLTTSNVSADRMPDLFPEIQTAEFVCLRFSDNGIGMKKAIEERIFEPFFTTKSPGKGTGLGLSSVYGIVKTHGGQIQVESAENQGTSFTIWLPASEKKAQKTSKVARTRARQGERILVVDDEQSIRDVFKEMLTESGYSVLTATDGNEAVRIFEQDGHSIRAVILDMVMPGIGGLDTYRRIKRINPEVKFIFSSGYSQDSSAIQRLIQEGHGFIQKPFDLNQMLQKLQEQF
jgi:PAS domain S-box-containing protein